MINLLKDGSFSIMCVDADRYFGCTDSFLLQVTFNIVKLDDYENTFNQSTYMFKESVQYLAHQGEFGKPQSQPLPSYKYNL